MDKTIVDQIRFCSFCPNVCRFYYPTEGIPQKESMFTSALAYLGLAILNGHVQYTKEVVDALSRQEGARACKEACPYHYDIPGDLNLLINEYRDKVIS
jgi:hypothetical protein